MSILRNGRGRISESCLFVLQVLRSYSESIKLGYRHIYQSLPRLLTLWYDFGSQLQALSPQAQVPIGCLTCLQDASSGSLSFHVLFPSYPMAPRWRRGVR